MKYFLSLGSNIDAKENLDFAQRELDKILTNLSSSTIHKTKAEGFEGDDFLNSVVSGECDDSFDELNHKLKLKRKHKQKCRLVRIDLTRLLP